MKREQRVGQHGQKTARSVLSGRCGIYMVEPIATPAIYLPVNLKQNIFRVIFGEKVSGDHTGIVGNGIFVKAETKTVLEGNLTWSHLRDHQPGKLTEHAEHGGISLLVWVYDDDAWVMRWPIEGFGPGKSISRERAQELDAETIQFLDWVAAQRMHDWNAPIDAYRITASCEQ
jgi:hypothetical protein